MKKSFLIFIVALSLTGSGCAYLKAQGAQAVADYKLCKADTAPGGCWEQVKKDQEVIDAAVSSVSGMFIPEPVAKVAGKVAGSILGGGLICWFLGRRKRKQSPPVA